ncbi:hypothetical protein KK083_03710 [Fulvivirgaceae bacterium PWU4]|uniref:IFT52 GIFT domain-containing protein n=1 Tax=Chryseosolibacter histidini TaxID=2782349 RepID=A0AAP2DIF7_9BACT|nr:GldG family protein [Chryseosolibacter histidini]MBT1695968.1 hypothetical protein [Chryseosolibacter histidini]
MRNIVTKHRLLLVASLMALSVTTMDAQPFKAPKKILVDIAHGQKFWNDPADVAGKDPAFIERIRYMTGELKKNAMALSASVGYIKSTITPQSLAGCDLLFIHIPSAKFSADEVSAIQQYVKKGGSLFLVAEVDYWATLEQTNVNDIVNTFGIEFKNDNPDQSSGGHSQAGAVTDKSFSIPYHGARIVQGGTPFCFSNKTDENPFGVYKEVDRGKVIAMGDGMVSLYMTSWEGVNNYQCSEFMEDVLAWLLK